MSNSNVLTADAPALSLTFRCVVQPGEGRFSRMVFPGRDELPQATADWPRRLQPGSMNCRVVQFPENFEEVAGPGDRIAKLDNAVFAPAFTIPANQIENNGLQPYPGRPRHGLAQVWPCAVTVEDTGEQFSAFHVRRVDGTYPPFHGVIELMAERKLRDAHGLQDGTKLAITMYTGEGPAAGPKQPESKGRAFLRAIGL